MPGRFHVQPPRLASFHAVCILVGMRENETLTGEVIAEALRKANEARMPPIECEECGAALYLLFSSNSGRVSLLNVCPCCGGAPVSAARALHLSARYGGGVLVEVGP